MASALLAAKEVCRRLLVLHVNAAGEIQVRRRLLPQRGSIPVPERAGVAGKIARTRAVQESCKLPQREVWCSDYWSGRVVSLPRNRSRTTRLQTSPDRGTIRRNGRAGPGGRLSSRLGSPRIAPPSRQWGSHHAPRGVAHFVAILVLVQRDGHADRTISGSGGAASPTSPRRHPRPPRRLLRPLPACPRSGLPRPLRRPQCFRPDRRRHVHPRRPTVCCHRPTRARSSGGSGSLANANVGFATDIPDPSSVARRLGRACPRGRAPSHSRTPRPARVRAGHTRHVACGADVLVPVCASPTTSRPQQAGFEAAAGHYLRWVGARLRQVQVQ